MTTQYQAFVEAAADRAQSTRANRVFSDSLARAAAQGYDVATFEADVEAELDRRTQSDTNQLPLQL